MSRIIDEAMRREFPDEDWPTMSVLRIEYVIPKKWTNRLVETAGSEGDPFPKMGKVLESFLEDEVQLIKFEIDD